VVGLMPVPSYVENAKKKGEGSFYQMSYEEMVWENSIPELPFLLMRVVFKLLSLSKEGLSQAAKEN